MISSATVSDLNFGNNREGKSDVLHPALKLCDLMPKTAHKENTSVAFWKSSANAELSRLMKKSHVCSHM